MERLGRGTLIGFDQGGGGSPPAALSGRRSPPCRQSDDGGLPRPGTQTDDRTEATAPRGRDGLPTASGHRTSGMQTSCPPAETSKRRRPAGNRPRALASGAVHPALPPVGRGARPSRCHGSQGTRWSSPPVYPIQPSLVGLLGRPRSIARNRGQRGRPSSPAAAPRGGTMREMFDHLAPASRAAAIVLPFAVVAWPVIAVVQGF